MSKKELFKAWLRSLFPKDLDGIWKNLHLIYKDIIDVRFAIALTRANQKGWTHQYMQNCRTMVEVGTVLSATLIGVGGPLLVVVGAVGWVL